MTTHHGVGWQVCQAARQLRRRRGARPAALLLRALGVPLPLAIRILGIQPLLET